MKIFFITTALLLVLGCQESEPTTPQIADCDNGFVPCENDSTICCEFTCEPTHYPCGETLTECCILTSSHDFVWEVDVFGLFGSELFGVDLDGDHIWAAGKVLQEEWIDDQWQIIEYDLLHFDGLDWYGIDATTDPLRDVHHFSADDIWVLYSNPTHWDGTDWQHWNLYNMGILDGGLRGKVWGPHTDDMYFVGSGGRIAHFNGESFESMDSHVTTELVDMIGGIQPDTNEPFAWISAYNQGADQSLLKLINGEWQVWYNQTPLQIIGDDSTKVTGKIQGIWSNSANTLWCLTKNGLYQVNGEDPLDFTRFDSENYWSWHDMKTLTGTGDNDLFFAGESGSLWHFNGETFQEYNIGSGCVFRDNDANETKVVAVGELLPTRQAVILRGYRQ